MKQLFKILPALLIAAGIFFLGLFIKAGFDNFSYRDRVVTVRGLAEKEVTANKVTWPVVYKEVGNDLQQIYNRITANNKVVMNFLTSNGIKQDEILVQAPNIIDLQAERYGATDRPYRYNVTSVIVVTSSNIEKVNELIKRQTDLLKEGVAVVSGDYQYNTIYEYTNLNEIKPEMKRDRARWGHSYAYWEDAVSGLRNYIKKRDSYIKKHAKSYFGLSNAEYEKYFGG